MCLASAADIASVILVSVTGVVLPYGSRVLCRWLVRPGGAAYLGCGAGERQSETVTQKLLTPSGSGR